MARQRAERQTSAGGVVVRDVNGVPHYLLIHDGHRNWAFPKGHVDDGESPQEAAHREVEEETGLRDLVILVPLGRIDWYFRHAGRLIHKYCSFFLFTSRAGDPVPQADEGIAACVWLEYDAARQRLTHPNSRRMLRLARDNLEAAARDGAAG